MAEFVIEDNVPIPEKRPSGLGEYTPVRQAVAKLEVNQSFVFHRLEGDKVRGAMRREQRASGTKFMTRMESKDFGRIWRLK